MIAKRGEGIWEYLPLRLTGNDHHKRRNKNTKKEGVLNEDQKIYREYNQHELLQALKLSMNNWNEAHGSQFNFNTVKR